MLPEVVLPLSQIPATKVGHMQSSDSVGVLEVLQALSSEALLRVLPKR